MNEDEHSGPDVILFDLGGVLMDFGGLRRLAELSGQEEGPALRSRWVASRWVQAFECGDCDAEAFAEGIVDDWGLDLTPAAFLDDFSRWSAGPFPGSLELVRSLRGTIRMGCVSNTNPVHWQRHLDRWGIVQHFEWTFTSHELGVMKPDPAVFHHVIRTIGTTPDRLLFLDDSDEHVRAARDSGMRAKRTRGLREVQDALRSLLPADSAAGRALRSNSMTAQGLLRLSQSRRRGFWNGGVDLSGRTRTNGDSADVSQGCRRDVSLACSRDAPPTRAATPCARGRCLAA